MSDVAIVKCKDYTEAEAKHALLEALSAIGGIDFIKPGMKVVIKVNLVTGKRPDTATTTHPVLVSELVKLLCERGAEVVVGDSPGGLYNAAWLSGIYSITGMKLCESAGATLNHDFKTKNSDCGGKVLHDFKYTAYLDDADLIIDFAKLKTHGMMVMSGAVKNMFGTIPGTTKPEYHSRFPDIDNFADMLIDLYEHFKPCLSIIDAVYGMEGNGPTSGTPRYVGGLIASYNGHYADMVAAYIMGIKNESLPLCKRAVLRNLCPNDISELDIYGNMDEFMIPDYELICNPDSPGLENLLPKPIAKLSEFIFKTKPVLDKEKCVGCEVCYNTCPKKAITMKNKRPQFDYKKCIRCFCCQEFCPKGALRVHRKLMAKIINGK